MGSAYTEHLDAIVVGAGFSGICLLHFLRQRGFKAKIYEAAEGIGGVWGVNDYPGARVDIDIPFYQLDFEEIHQEWTWTENFPGQPELKKYFEFVDQKLQISKDTRFGARISKAEYDNVANEWVVDTTSGFHSRATFLLPCVGYASKPYIPTISGLKSFGGTAFHSTAWPKELDLTGKRVGVIGTGASGVQIIQEIGPLVGHLTVFQRNINTALPSWLRSFQPGEHDEMKKQCRTILEARKIGFGGVDAEPTLANAMDVREEERQAVFERCWAKGAYHILTDNFQDCVTSEASNAALYEFWRRKVGARIHDPEIQEKLAPTKMPYPIFAKRTAMETTYYEVFNQTNVTLVDVNTDPIVEVTPSGIRTGIESYDLDVLVLATGFDATGGGLGAIDIRGLDKSTSLAESWIDGKSTYLGMSASGFPNFLFAYGPQSPGGYSNGPACAQWQSDWIAKTLQYMRDNGKVRIDPVKEAEVAYSEQTKAIAGYTLMCKAKSWQFGWNVPGQKIEPLFYLGGVESYLAKLEGEAAEGYPGFLFQ